ncbi:MAG TPA: TetR family transcriptional regulator C-terminal domain-containing protein [Mesorhizobium sp.]|jgi:AcrR family transcriptional regulator|uniref:TetR/AcrR family transcriptional regulator n=1 Tax=Mesorhizobium sp. TaxID=1871066 RepID=UPI002DDDA79D|nr:TetR family transcriptional regulator C-terminal domain-containing protein [Mesorhizobium sp.]HEV2506883.1 TetR family transcriptional regulator C-terminal domain-containing protein [Mesorhizobium sp.]
MSRPAAQAERRLTLISAAETMIAKHGLAGVTLRAVANEAGMSSSAALYYYPGLKDLLDDVQKQAVERFCTLRAMATAQISDPRERLKAMIRSGIPDDPSDRLCRLLMELGAYARSDAAYAARHITLFERQVAIYVGILEAGAITGTFKLSDTSDTLARSLVILEDGLGLHLLNVVPAVDYPTALRILTAYAETTTGCRLT